MAEESSFAGIIKRLKGEGELLRNSGTNSIKSLKEINLLGFDVLVDQMGELIDFFKGNALQDEENRRELLKALKDGKKEEKKEDKKVKSGGFKIPDLSSLLGVLTSAITGLTVGLAFGIGESIFGILKFFTKGINKLLFKPLLRFFKSSYGLNTKTFKTLQGRFLRFTESLKGIGRTFRDFVKRGKGPLTTVKTFLKGFIGSISGFIKNTKLFRILRVKSKLFRKEFIKNAKPVLEIFKAIPKAFGSIGGLISKVIPGGGGGLMKIFKPLKTFFGMFGKVLPTFFNLGRTLGKLFLPFTIIISLVDFVKGAFAGFEQYKDKGVIAGLIGGLLGGIGGLVTGLLGMPLDLLKSAVSWVAEKLGFENFSEILDSFSFSELIGGLFTKVTDAIFSFFSGLSDSVSNIGFGNTLKNISLGLLKIFKKIYSFPVAVAAGAAMALKAALPGGQTPIEAFKEGFATVFNAGDATIDSFKTPVPAGGEAEAEENVLAIKESPEERLDRMAREGSESVDAALETPTNNTGAQMEVGMSNIADAKSQPAPVIVSGGEGAPQTTVVNNSNTTFNGSEHPEESNILTRPLTTRAYGF
jgi:hypothetical protein